MGDILTLQEASVSYADGTMTALGLDRVSLRVGAGEILSIMGPSGCGKSTLLKVLGLTLRPTEGTVLLDSRPVPSKERQRAAVRNRIFGIIPQDISTVSGLPALRNVAMPLEYRRPRPPRGERRRLATDALAAVGLEWAASRNPTTLSGGERQRIAIARALVGSPSIVLADEPTAALDRRTADTVIGLMIDLAQRRGTAVVIATHDARVAERCSRVLTMDGGALASRDD